MSSGNLHIAPHVFSTLLKLLHLGTQEEVFTFAPHQCRFSLRERDAEPLLFNFFQLRCRLLPRWWIHMRRPIVYKFLWHIPGCYQRGR